MNDIIKDVIYPRAMLQCGIGLLILKPYYRSSSIFYSVCSICYLHRLPDTSYISMIIVRFVNLNKGASIYKVNHNILECTI
jgi:hypothetical protein